MTLPLSQYKRLHKRTLLSPTFVFLHGDGGISTVIFLPRQRGKFPTRNLVFWIPFVRVVMLDNTVRAYRKLLWTKCIWALTFYVERLIVQCPACKQQSTAMRGQYYYIITPHEFHLLYLLFQVCDGRLFIHNQYILSKKNIYLWNNFNACIFSRYTTFDNINFIIITNPLVRRLILIMINFPIMGIGNN